MLGQVIDRYTLVEKLGSGGMGEVFKGHHASLDQYRAVKVLPLHLSQNPELVERFRREAKRGAALSHPNIVRLEHVGEQDGLHYLVMDYVSGRSLRQLIDEQGPLAPERAARIALDLCGALGHAHAHGVIHRDVKPSNILVEESGRALLTDFGIARWVTAEEPRLTAMGETVGTPEYLSPEQIRGEAVDGRSDLYSLGVVLYEALTGELPFSARSPASIKRQHLEKLPDSPRFHNPAVPEALERVVLQALAKDPAARFGTAAELEQALLQALNEPAAPVRTALNGRAREAVTLAGTSTIGWLGGTTSEGVPPDAVSVAATAGAGAKSATRPEGGVRREEQDERPTVLTSPERPRGPLSPRPPIAWAPVWERLRRQQVAAGAAAAFLTILLAVLLLQRLGSAGATGRFTAEKAVDPRTGDEYGIVRAHGLPVLVITQPFGELKPAQRAERTAEQLERMLSDERGGPLEPEQLDAVHNGRGELVLARRRKGVTSREPDPEDVIVTVDAPTATSYTGTNRSSLALWWRDLLRDQIRLAHGKPPVSTFDTRYGRILDTVYQRVEPKRRDGWVPPQEIRRAVNDLSDPHQEVVKEAWHTVPAAWRSGSGESLPPGAGLEQVRRENAYASDTLSGTSPEALIDGDPHTAWQSHHGPTHHGSRHWLKVVVPDGARVSEVELREGQRSRPEYQLHIKQAKATFSDGSSQRLWRKKPTDPLRISLAPRSTRWVKLDVEQVFANRDPHESHLCIAEVRLWGP
jgi:hypothetical protein